MSEIAMSEAQLEVVADRFRLLSDPMRLRILQCLREGEATVSQLVEATQSSQPNVSKHLSILKSAGLVKRRQEGNSAYFSVGAPFVFELCAIVCDGVRKELEDKQARFS